MYISLGLCIYVYIYVDLFIRTFIHVFMLFVSVIFDVFGCTLMGLVDLCVSPIIQVCCTEVGTYNLYVYTNNCRQLVAHGSVNSLLHNAFLCVNR